MTQARVRVDSPEDELLAAPIPLPRVSTELRVSAPTVSDRPADPAWEAAELAALDDELSALPSPRARRAPAWAIWLDTVLASVLAVGAAATGMLSAPVALLSALAWPLLLLSAGHYRRSPLGHDRFASVWVVLATGLRGAVLALAVSPWLVADDLVALAELVAVFSVASAVPSLLVGRRHRPRLVLAGRPRDVREAMIELELSDRHEIVAACLTRRSKVPLDLPTYVGFDSSSQVAHRHDADAVVVLPGARLTPTEVRRLHWSLAGVGAELYLGTGLLDVEPQRTRVVATGGIDVLHVTRPVLDGPRRLLKDVVERALALVAFVAALPVLAVLCLAIRLETPGPALFRQERIGRDGVPFTMLKLRSMGVDAEAVRQGLAASNEKDGVLFKIADDPRITRLGARLRRYSLDELPQLWNVVRGDMSLVGPRPALPSEVAQYDIDPKRRLVVKPGVTGLWQVSGRSDLTWAESVRLDLKYVDNWSLGLDARILVRTVRAVLGHRGAY
ncbi:exopolysaccharide biosynthesis polyprenyl glycosylphosphotransferase [Nocardioides sp. J2M5]|uniref:exopolysaccharide biosynthesis polyprenyl glycosylphosphotransferase n=1 Tax=Nocardioides palaemonis TaxID=2829810 RepID=UPI001BA8E004|nr:exopolysaccharide biosynthesis polyprenyl glycosylphosphotransferase [Nocardioides palaemonis]MBS2936709.1 exopolysaccharide biosynthesis polyprenyl glycosylphosphotransferase [Nocardioides palaemonis]